MIYPTDFESKLGFNQIREKLKNYCLGSLGQNQVEKIRFSSDYQFVRTQLKQVWELKLLKESGEVFPLTQYEDPTAYWTTLAIEGGYMEADALHQLALSMQIIFDCIDLLTRKKESYPVLYQLSSTIELERSLVKHIHSKVDETGYLRDNASHELARIRKKLKDELQRARKLIDHLFRRAAEDGLVPEESLPVMRQGRVVIPVKAEHKRRLKGVIMDESATGQTVYIEPTEVLEANNDIRNLELEERRESIKILKELANVLRSHLQPMKEAYTFLSTLDLIQAKVKLAAELDAGFPELIRKPELEWFQARHPLLVFSHLEKGDVVPLNINLTEDDRFLLVSGPNAGGKSVCLKTVGLLQYMWQCGLLIPVGESSKVGLFDNIFLDIGDQQSIENDLSTYSSHLRNMKHFVEKATENTLVLMDELGAGTDPNFGGGIAEAILRSLVLNRTWGVATTHYYNLKMFAEQQKGIRNAAMLFDGDKLEPLFQLEIGKPGSSFALEIARKIGLSENVLSQAEQKIGEDLIGLETLIKKVNDENQQLLFREREIKEKEIKYNQLLNKYQQLTKELELNQKQIINKAKSEAAQLLKQTNREIEKTIRHIKENRAEKKETRKVRESLYGLSKAIVPSEEVKTLDTAPLQIGDYVKIKGQEVVGKIISIVGKKCVVQFGDMRSTVNLSNLEKSSARQLKSKSVGLGKMGIDMVTRQSSFKTILDVRGKRADEIISTLDHFLDDALLLGHHQLSILHGKGEGVLRKLIRERLSQNSRVASFGDEHVERGGAGITLVILK